MDAEGRAMHGAIAETTFIEKLMDRTDIIITMNNWNLKKDEKY